MALKTQFNGNVIDVEASGLSTEAYPIEVGVVLGTGRYYSNLIRPCEEWQYWCVEAEAIHGISFDDLRRQGQPVDIVCRDLNALLKDETVYSDCWVKDSEWLNKLYGAAGIRPSFYCQPIEYFAEDHVVQKWPLLKSRTQAKLKLRQHRALHDAIIIAQTLDEIMPGREMRAKRYAAGTKSINPRTAVVA